jgi:hypothetical protein
MKKIKNKIKEMKNLPLFLCLFFACRLYSQVEEYQCQSAYFASDTSFYFYINELKPCGNNKFVEIWNCKSVWWYADTLVISGMYSGGSVCLLSVSFPPQSYSVLPVPTGLSMQDGIRIRRSWDTVDRYSMSYAITDMSHSIGFCENWYTELSPTPGSPNNCFSTALPQIPTGNMKLSALFDLCGKELPISCTVRGLYIGIYENDDDQKVRKLVFFGN